MGLPLPWGLDSTYLRKMNLQCCYNAGEDTFSLPQHIKDLYGPFGFPEPADASRPYITSNFVMGVDGRASFKELKGLTGGRTVSRSREDRWLMDFLRAHHDGQLIGASTLRDERDRRRKVETMVSMMRS